MSFAEVLAGVRLASGLSQEALAARAAVSVRAISDLERGVTTRPQRETVRALADGLGLAAAERDRFERAAYRQRPLPARGRRGGTATLPAPMTSIVGRDADVVAVTSLLGTAGTRLVTVTGAGGVGKTRLAVDVGWRLAAGYGRVTWVDLGAVGDPADVPAAICAAVHGRPVPAGSLATAAEQIGTGHWLLVLDCVDRVAGAAGGLAELLAGCPRLSLLATSRMPLRLRAEHLWPLAPLPVPAADDELPSLAANPAVALLVERARAVRPQFALGEPNAAAVAALTRRLDGLPLAIELAAARLRNQDPADLVGELRQRLTQLRAVAVDVPQRHESLRATVAWSADQLAPTDRLVLAAAAVFAGGAAYPALRSVVAATGAGPQTVEAAVGRLADASLVTVADAAGQPRVRMLDTVREAALELPDGPGPAAARAHASYMCDLLGAAAGDPAGLEQVDAELDNVRAALAWAVAGDPALLDPAAVRGLTDYYVSRGHFPEARRILTAVAERAADLATQAYALLGAGIAANEDGAAEAAVTLGAQAASLLDRLGDQPGRCAALTLLGNAHKAAGDYELAQAAHRACLDLAREAGDTRRVGVALNNLGTVAHDLGDHDQAREHYAATLAVKQELADERGIAIALVNLGCLANDRGGYAEAQAQLRRAIDIFRDHGEQRRLAFALIALADAAHHLGRRDDAAGLVAEAIRTARRVQYRPAIGLALARLGDLGVTGNDRPAAERCYREALDHLTDAPEIARVRERLASLHTDAAG